jgi:hypothetical protein
MILPVFQDISIRIFHGDKIRETVFLEKPSRRIRVTRPAPMQAMVVGIVVTGVLKKIEPLLHL